MNSTGRQAEKKTYVPAAPYSLYFIIANGNKKTSCKSNSN